jgi:hypothetical protein
MKRLDLQEAGERYLKALVYGRSGTGKTGFGVSAPKPLILLSERQGYVHIVDAARRLGKPVPPTLYVETIVDYRNVARALHGDKSKPFVVRDEHGATLLELAEWPETVVIDSLTDACHRLVDDIRRRSPPKDGKDGLPVDSERFWNVLADSFQKLVHTFRDAPMNALFLCLLDERVQRDDNDVETSRWVGPQLAMRKMPGVIQASVNVVGVTYRKVGPKGADGERSLIYGVMTNGPDWMDLKPYRPLRDAEVMDFASWIRRINGVEDGSAAPPPIANAKELDGNGNDNTGTVSKTEEAAA